MFDAHFDVDAYHGKLTQRDGKVRWTSNLTQHVSQNKKIIAWYSKVLSSIMNAQRGTLMSQFQLVISHYLLVLVSFHHYWVSLCIRSEGIKTNLSEMIFNLKNIIRNLIINLNQCKLELGKLNQRKLELVKINQRKLEIGKLNQRKLELVKINQRKLEIGKLNQLKLELSIYEPCLIKLVPSLSFVYNFI